MKRLRARLTYANVMATIAVFIALGGASYAAIKLPKNSVGTKQLKRGAVTPAKLSGDAALALRGPQGQQGPKGDPGPKGDAGPPATELWAKVAAAGGPYPHEPDTFVGSKKLATGAYNVEFNRDVSECAYLATMNFSTGELIAEESALNDNSVLVETFDSAGTTSVDRWFSLAVYC